MQKTTLSALDWPALADAFNTVYSGYLVPLTMNEAQMRHHCTTTDVALDRSPLWLDDSGAIIGLAALAVRGERGWIGGFGIAPAYRGKGVSHTLIRSTLDIASGLGLRQIQLEVLSNNTFAIRTYQYAGFTHRRDLRILARLPDTPHLHGATSVVESANPSRILQHAGRLHNLRPVWQRETDTLHHLPDLHGLILGNVDAPRGYVLYHATDTDIRLADLAAVDGDSAALIIAALGERLPGRMMSLINEAAESPLCAALERSGWRETLRQQEMLYTV